MIQLPNDIKLEILTHLDYETIVSVAKTSKNLAKVAKCEFLWKRKLEQLPHAINYYNLSNRQFYLCKVGPLILIQKHVKSLIACAMAFKYQKSYKPYLFYPDEQLIIFKHLSEIYLTIYSSTLNIYHRNPIVLYILDYNSITVKSSPRYITLNPNTIEALLETGVTSAFVDIYGPIPSLAHLGNKERKNVKFMLYLTTIDDFIKMSTS